MDQKSVDLIYNHNSVNKRLVFVNQRVFIIYNLSFRKQKKHLIWLEIHIFPLTQHSLSTPKKSIQYKKRFEC